jgi:hypothetical protein
MCQRGNCPSSLSEGTAEIEQEWQKSSALGQQTAKTWFDLEK